MRTRAPRGARLRQLAAALAVVMAAAGCRQDMHDAPRYDPLESSEIFPNGASARPLVAGTVARGFLDDDVLRTTGKIDGQAANEFPFPITRDDLDRGQQRFNIYCSPCHGRTGEGNGMVVQRGYRQPPSYHIDRLRQAPAGYFFDVITNGFGVMPDYRAQVPVDDRWRIVAYIRALQLTHQGTTADVPAADLEKLQHPETAAAATAPAGEGTH
jgi:mono/diheme cytochrome c family protein